MKMPLRPIAAALCLGFWLSAAHLPAAEIEGVVFADEVVVENVEFKLCGMALQRYMLFFNGYVGALYLPAGTRPGDAMDDVSKHLVLQYFHDIKKEDFQTSTIAGVRKNVSEASYREVEERLLAFNALYRDVKSGQRYSLTYIKGKGSTLSLQNTPLGTIQGRDFSFAVFSIWLGENPIGESFRDILLGKK